MMLKWMHIDGSHNLANGYGWIWISSNVLHGYGCIWIYLIFLSIDMDGYGIYKSHPCQSVTSALSAQTLPRRFSHSIYGHLLPSTLLREEDGLGGDAGFSSISPWRYRTIQRLRVHGPIFSCLVTQNCVGPQFKRPTAR